MLIEKIDVGRIEPPQALVGDLQHMLGPAVQAALGLARTDIESEFGRDDGALTPTLERTAQQLLVAEGSVDFGGIEQRHAQFQRALQGGERFRVVGRPVTLAHAHAAETECGHTQSLCSQVTQLHDVIRALSYRRCRPGAYCSHLETQKGMGLNMKFFLRHLALLALLLCLPTAALHAATVKQTIEMFKSAGV